MRGLADSGSEQVERRSRAGASGRTRTLLVLGGLQVAGPTTHRTQSTVVIMATTVRKPGIWSSMGGMATTLCRGKIPQEDMLPAKYEQFVVGRYPRYWIGNNAAAVRMTNVPTAQSVRTHALLAGPIIPRSARIGTNVPTDRTCTTLKSRELCRQGVPQVCGCQRAVVPQWSDIGHVAAPFFG